MVLIGYNKTILRLDGDHLYISVYCMNAFPINGQRINLKTKIRKKRRGILLPFDFE